MIFFKDLIKDLIEDGHTVDIACNESEYKVDDFYRELGCRIYPISWTRSPFSRNSFKAIRELKKLVKENNYDIVHCHTPVAGICTRIACKGFRKNGLKVFYTAHGFHFYKGAPLKNWILYFPIEWMASFFTDTLITINTEDYERAKKHLHARRTEYVPGVGVDIEKFRSTIVDKTAKRREIGIPDDGFVIISVGELNYNKNQKIIIEALEKIDNNNIHYIIVGKGQSYEELVDTVKQCEKTNQVHFLGYRNDINELFKISDCCAFPSIREGFGIVAIECMASGVPLICSDNRGTRSYAIDAVNAIVCKKNVVSEYVSAIEKMMNGDYRHQLELNLDKTVDRYDVHRVVGLMKSIYYG